MNNEKNLFLLKSEINSIDPRTNPERVRFSLYSIYVIMLINKKLFKKNSDIKELCDELNINFKDYVFRSRTLLIARFMRKIEKIDSEEVYLFFEIAKKKISHEQNKESIKKETKSDKDNIFDKFGR